MRTLQRSCRASWRARFGAGVLALAGAPLVLAQPQAPSAPQAASAAPAAEAAASSASAAEPVAARDFAAELASMWDYDDPAGSEKRFRAALASAQGDEALMLRTQIARTLSLRNRFAEAHAELDALAPQLGTAGPAAQVYALLERGRTVRSAGDPVGARPWFDQALAIAEPAGLEALQADAMHMVALVEPTPEGQVLWNQRVAAFARGAQDPRAQRWAGPALNNLGVTLSELGRLDEALEAFRAAVPVYAQRGRPTDLRVARWQVAHTLRLLGRGDEALPMQLELEQEGDAAGQPDAEVFDELVLLYEARGDASRAAHYRERLRAMREAAARIAPKS